MSRTLRIRNAREHNLQGISLEIPRDALVVVTGVSGSGKSSLAFDTIFQEGQRRYIESLSAYARQFIGTMQRPDVESVQGISPTISIDQKTVNRNPRSTVGTVVEILDHYRLLFSRLGTPHCPSCGKLIRAQTPEQIVDSLLLAHSGRSVLVLAPIVQERKGEYRKELADLREQGFVRARIDGQIVRLDEAPALGRYEKHTIEVVVDRLNIEPSVLSRLREAVEGALRFTQGKIVTFLLDDVELLTQSTQMACAPCGISLPELEPRLFSFNDPHGQCPRCRGLGKTYCFEEDLLIPDTSSSIQGGAIKAQVAAGNIMFSKHGTAEFQALAGHYGFSLATPWKDLSPRIRRIVLHGSDVPIKYRVRKDGIRGPVWEERNDRIPGVVEVLQELWDQWHISLFHKFMRVETCPQCHGARLHPAALAVRFHERNIHELSVLSVEQAGAFFDALQLQEREARVGVEIFKEIRNRLGFLRQVGLGYLTLDRTANTLSGGEAQRIRLAAQVGAGLQGVLYVLDEPSIGLHPRDNGRLLDILERLRDQGNSLIVVEHDEETMRRADWVVDIGPGAGVHGGLVTAEGHWESLVRHPDSLTGRYLSGVRYIALPEARRPIGKAFLEVVGASANNLKNITVSFPLGVFTVVTGVSGSGKSTLVDGILRRALAAHFHGALEEPLAHREIRGLEHLDKVIEIDQTPIGRTPRSNPATYTKLFDDIRDLFASLPESRVRGYSKSRFSFNVKGGRCEECEGAGVKEIEMQILPNVQVTCEVCHGKRFNSATLEVHFRGKTIADVLAMTIDEAGEFFADHPRIRKVLAVLQEIGLGYVQLGQPSTTLSGGEAQRMKISTELRRPGTGRTLYLLDEPTTGLHFEDVRRLLECMQRLVQSGNTLVVIEHNLDVVKCADWVIDLGPEAGEGGGALVAQGTPEQVAAHQTSQTGHYLAPVLASTRALQSAAASNSTAETIPYSLVAESAPRRRGRPPKQVVQTPPAYHALPAGSVGGASHGPDIEIEGARKHNLRNVSLRIPRHQLTVISGVSGSGKSSLAFHTLFAEGQRRFVESLSTYARRFLGKMDRGHVDSIRGLAPAIAIDQGSASRSPRSTVATLTEIYDYFRILWARVGIPHCPQCGLEAHAWSAPQAVAFLQSLTAPKGASASGASLLTVVAPIYVQGHNKPLMAAKAAGVQPLGSRLVELGYRKLWIDGRWHSTDSLPDTAQCTQAWAHVDALATGRGSTQRLREAVDRAYDSGHGMLGYLEPRSRTVRRLTLHPSCPSCSWGLESELDPRNFSFNSHWGACPTCQGLGVVGGSVCPDCRGERLKPDFRAVQIGGKGIAAISALTIAQAREWFGSLRIPGSMSKVAQPLLREITGRLDFLLGVGLGYMGLGRSGETLSGGEAQRMRLASQIGSGLEGVLYVLDEPTVGLHQRDTDRLLVTLRQLRDLGNTLVVVEHDLEFIKSADYLVDMGPAAGDGGGQIVAQGTPAQVAALRRTKSLTAHYLSGRMALHQNQPPRPVPPAHPSLHLSGVRRNNLRDVSVRIPQGRLTGVAGVSGSGKSSLIMDGLLPLVQNSLRKGARRNLALGKLQIDEPLQEVILVDQEPIGGTPRSTPASYIGVLDPIRDLYASLPQSKLKGFDKGRFSYNKAGGRCEACEGKGYNLIEMHFLSDVWEACDICKGRRYNAETLEVRFREKSIADILDLRIAEAADFFKDHRRIGRPLSILRDVGLGYLRLGQAATTLSGGEAQRLKLAAELGQSRKTNTLYLLDEPSTGLHLHDIQALWNILQGLVDHGHTVVFVEHHPSMLAMADWIIDMGPEGGDGGGQILYQGPVAPFINRKPPTATSKALGIH